MIATIHLLAGMAIAAFFPASGAAPFLAFVSHYILDFLPHLDPATFRFSDQPYTRTQITLFLADTVAVVTILVMVWLYSQRWQMLIINGMIAQLPDLLTPWEESRFFKPLRFLHQTFHWEGHRAERWEWYIGSIVSSVTVGTLCLLVIWNYT